MEPTSTIIPGVSSATILVNAAPWAAAVVGVILIALGYRVVLRVANFIVAKFGGGKTRRGRRRKK